jgi:hypothetical protein
MPVVKFRRPIKPPRFANDKRAVSVWAAGVVDTDGCIQCSQRINQGRVNPSTHSQVVVTQHKKGVPLLRVMVLLFGRHVLQKTVATETTTAAFTWEMYGGKAVPFLRRIEPYLILKGEQARLFIQLEERRVLEARRGGRNHTPEFLKFAKGIVDRMRKLNQVGLKPRDPYNPNRLGRRPGTKNGEGRYTAIPRK